MYNDIIITVINNIISWLKELQAWLDPGAQRVRQEAVSPYLESLSPVTASSPSPLQHQTYTLSSAAPAEGEDPFP